MKNKPTLSDYEQASFHLGCVVGHIWKVLVALYRTKGGRAVFAVILLAVLFALNGCNTARKPSSAIEPAPILASQEGKDTTIVSEAAKIDAIAPAAKPHTDAQRAAVAAAPAADVAKLVNGYEAKIKELTDQIVGLNKMIENLKDAEQKKQVATLRWFGLGALAIAGLLAWAQQVRFAAVGALVGMVSLGLAQIISQPWFMPTVGIASAVALIALGWAAWHAYKKGTLARNVESEASRLNAALTTIVPAVDSAIESLDDAAKTVIKNALSRSMDADHKRLIKEIRAKL
jgi:hypothetical protein